MSSHLARRLRALVRLHPPERNRRLLFEPLESRRVLSAIDGVETLPGHWIAQFEGLEGSAEEQRDALTQRLADAGLSDVAVVQSLGLAGMFTLETAQEVTIESITASIAGVEGYLYVQADRLIGGNLIPSDTSFGNLWGMHNTGQNILGVVGTADADIDAPEAWDLATGNSSVIVGVIDSGIDFTHPDLNDNLFVNPSENPTNGIDDDGNGFVDDWRGWDFFNNDNNPTDDNGHGTHVSGTIGAEGNNAQGVAGVNWDVSILPLKFLGAGNTGPVSAAVAAINYATMMRNRGFNIKVTNNSWGASFNDPALDAAISAHRAAGILFVAAAANGGTDGIGDNNDVTPNFPSNYAYDNIIAVAALNNQNQRPSFSNYGPTTVDLGAPGVSVYSTVPTFVSASGYAYFDGTSMATPHVTGTAALIWSAAPTSTYTQVRDAILQTVDPVSALSGLTVTGGRLNTRRALEQFFAGPRVSSFSLGTDAIGAATSVTLNFSKTIDPATFTTADIVAFGGPGGANLLPSLTGITPVSSTSFRIDFAPQPLAGNYSLTVGPDIRDASGNQMDQDADLVAGEIPQDRFTANFSIAGPRITSSTPTGQQAGPISNITFTFSKSFDLASVTTADLASFTGPGGVNLIPAVTSFTQVSSTQLRVDFSPQTSVGNYSLTIGPDIRDLAGNPMDQDADGIPAEPTQDQFTSTFSIAAPRVSSHTPSSAQAGPVSAVTFTFTKAIDSTTFTTADLFSFAGPGGVNLLPSVTGVTSLSSTSFRVDFAAQGAAGNYSLVIGPDIRDPAGNPLDQNSNNILGEVPGDRYTAGFSITAPRINSASPTGTQAGPVGSLTFSFSKNMDGSTFTAADIASFTGPGAANLLSAVTGVVVVNATTIRVDFTPQGPAGSYSMIVGPDIRDTLGNQLDQDFDNVPGEALQDRFTASFSISAPRVTASTPANAAVLVGPLSNILLDFSKTMDAASFTAADLTFTGPAGVDLVPSVTNIVPVTSTRFQVNFTPVNLSGSYQLLVGPNVLDVVGNPLDQDSDGAVGEPLQDRFSLGFNLNCYGPDGFGYTGCVSTFENINLETGQPGVFLILDNVDDGAAAVDLGGNRFNFYGTTYTGANQLFVSTNGLVTFGAGVTSSGNSDLSFAPNERAIAPFWDDLKTNVNAQDRVLGKFEDLTGDSVPDRLIIEWSQIQDWAVSGNGDGTFQLILQLNTGVQVSRFAYNFVDLDFGTGFTDNGASATTGIKDTGTSNPTRVLVSSGSSSNPFVGGGKAIQWSAGNVIRGQKWQDLDFDGTRDAGEGGLSGWTIYLDLDSDQDLDAGEPLTQTDANGNYSFSDLPPGNYVVREVNQPGWQQTAPTEIFFTPLTNNGFETGVFAPEWTTTGVTNVVAAFGGVTAPEGARQATASNLTGSVLDTALATFMGRPATSLDTLIGANAIEGSAIRRTFSATAGQVLSFQWNFYTNQSPNTSTSNDFSFVSVLGPGGVGTLQVLSSTFNTFVSPPGAFTFLNMTGYRTFSYTIPADGAYTFVVGAADVSSTATDSQIMIDDLQLNGGTISFGRAHRLTFSNAKTTAFDRDFGNYLQTGDALPVADAGGPYSVPEGGSVVLSAAASVDPDDETITLYEWDLNYDGSFQADLTSSSPLASFSAAGLDGATARAIAVRVTDADGLTDIDTEVISVTNAAPAVVLNPVVAIDENGTTTLSGTISDAATADTFSLSIDWGDPTSPNNVQTFTFPASPSGSQTFSFTHQYLDDKPSGTSQDGYAITATVTDDDGGSGSDQETAVVRDLAPAVVLNPVVTINENGTASLSGTVTDVGRLDTFTLVINWGDPASPNNIQTISLPASATGSQAFSLTHPYLDDNPSGTTQDGYTISATVTDDDGLAGNDTELVTVRNVAPTLSVNSIASINEGGTATLSGTISDVGRLDTFSLAIVWGDPTSPNNTQIVTFPASATGSQSFSVTHQYLDDKPSGTSSDSYTVSVTLQDDDGGTASTSRSVSVSDVAPVVVLNSVATIGENGIATLTGTVTDPGTLDTFTLNVTWGDPASPNNTQSISLPASSTGSQTFSLTHQYLDDRPSGTSQDTYTILVIANDDDNRSGSDTEPVLVRNVSPGVLVNPVAAIEEGGTVTITGTIFDTGTLDTYTLTIDWGDPTSPSNVQDFAFPAMTSGSRDFTLTHIYLDDKPSGTGQDSYQIRATIRDDDNGIGLGGQPITVRNVAPALSVNPLAAINEAGMAVLTGMFTDPGVLDTYTLVVDWGNPGADFNVMTIPIGAVGGGAPWPFTISQTYWDDSPTGTSQDEYVVTATITDDDGGTVFRQQTLVVRNVAPIVGLDPVAAIDENGVAVLHGTIRDRGIFDTYTLVVDWGDPGSPDNLVTVQLTHVTFDGSLPFTLTHQYRDDVPSGSSQDDFVIRVTVMDDDGGVGIPTVQSDIFSTHAGGTRLGTIDRATGAGSDIGSFGTINTWAAAFDTDGRLFTLFDGFSGNARLGIVNQATGAVTPVGSGVGTNMIALEVAPDGTMYGVGYNDRLLYRIDKTLGSATPIGDTGISFVMDLAFDPFGILYATVENRLWLVKTVTGASQPVGTISGAMHIMGIMFDASGNMLATDFMPAAPLLAVNLTTLTANVIGATGFDFPHGGDIFVQTGVPAEHSVTVRNVAPNIHFAALSSTSINEGESVTVTGSFSDPALGVSTETFTGTATWSDGVSTPVSIVGGTFSTTRTFADDNPTGTSADTFTVDISISDDDGGSGALGTPDFQSDIFSTHAGGTRLGTIDRTTGAGSDVGSFGTFDTWAAAFDTAGRLFTLFDGFSGNARLGIVNQTTGAITPVGSGVGTYMITLEVAPDGTMYGVGYNDRMLYRIDKTLGTATSIGDTGIFSVMDLAFNSAGVLYATVGNDLWTLNTATGASTSVGTISGAMHVMGIMFDAGDNLLATDFMPAAPLFAVNLTTLAAAVVGPTGFDFPHGGDIFVQTGVPSELSVTVNNVDPVIVSLSATSVNENGLVTLRGTYSDTGTQDTHTLTINWGEGPVTLPLPVSGGSFSFTHQYLDDHPSGTPSDVYTIDVTLTDDDTGTDTGTTTTTITNVDPVLALPSNTSPCCGDATENEAISVNATFTDVGTLDTHSATIDWGDGTTTPANIGQAAGGSSLSGGHAYATGGIFTVTITLTDDDGGTATQMTTVVISGVGVVGDTLYVIGTAGDDHVTINQDGTDYKVHADFLATGSFRNVPTAGIARIVVQTCAGDDHVTVSGGIGLPTFIDGGEGGDQLNGGSGPNIIVGGPGDDHINGGSGRDILIGGTGADSLVGNSADDLLISGTTAYDANKEALTSMMAEWNSVRSYSQRVHNLSSGTGGNGLDNSSFASRANGAFFLIGDDVASQTVFNDNEEDKITGSSASDWFFANLVADNGGTLDLITDNASSEQSTDIDY